MSSAMASKASYRAQATFQAVRACPVAVHQTLSRQLHSLGLRGSQQTTSAPVGLSFSRQSRRIVTVAAAGNGTSAGAGGLKIDLTGMPPSSLLPDSRARPDTVA